MKGTELKKAREVLGYSEQTLGEIFGISKQTVIGLEGMSQVDTRTELAIRFLFSAAKERPLTGTAWKNIDLGYAVRLLEPTITHDDGRVIRWFVTSAGQLYEAWEDDFVAKFEAVAEEDK